MPKEKGYEIATLEMSKVDTDYERNVANHWEN